MPPQLCLLPPCSASSKNCQSYPQLLQPIQSSEKLFNQNFISPLCHLWTWVGLACCSHPQSFQETFQPPLPPWCMLEILNFLSLHKRVLLLPHQRTDVFLKHLLYLAWIHCWKDSGTFWLSLPPQVLTANCLINVSYYSSQFPGGNWACLDGRYCQHLPF